MTLSIQRPLPSMKMHAGLFERVSERIAGELAPLIGIEDLRGAVATRASSRTAMQKSASMVLESRHDRTLRLAQSPPDKESPAVGM
jgi:hypothetical protein